MKSARSAGAEFIRTEAAGGIALVAVAVVALVWANSPWDASYHSLWSTNLSIGPGSHSIDLTLEDWVNEVLMTIFFFVVGLEIKRELVDGELRTPRRAALPAIAAAGGMCIPPLIYLLINAGTPAVHGWGIPMATDIAIAVGVATLLGARMSPSLKVFLLALAIVDDIGTIGVIALFYSETVHPDALGLAVVIVGVVALCRVARVRFIAVYVALGVALWWALFEAGVHPTIAGVVLGLMAPRDVIGRLEHALHPWSTLFVVPMFVLANAGIPLDASALTAAATSRVAYGVFVGLVVGKFVGVLAFSWLAVRAKIGVLPTGTSFGGIAGMAALSGIGFTVSIFVAGLAFDDIALQDEAKVAILAASLVAGALGAVLLSFDARRRGPQRAPRDSRPGSNPSPA